MRPRAEALRAGMVRRRGGPSRLEPMTQRLPLPLGAAGAPPGQVRHLNQVELARRWRMSERTLERWRWLRQGPAYLKIGARVAYRLEDVEAFEAERLRAGAKA